MEWEKENGSPSKSAIGLELAQPWKNSAGFTTPYGFGIDEKVKGERMNRMKETPMNAKMHQKDTTFPFQQRLSLLPVHRFLKGIAQEERTPRQTLAGIVLKELEKAPELLEPIDDPGVLREHRNILDLVLNIIFPAATWESDCCAVFAPFHDDIVCASPSFHEFFKTKGDSLDFRNLGNLQPEQWHWGSLISAYGLVTKRHFDLELGFDYPLVVSAPDPKTGLDRFMSLQFDSRFLDIVPTSEVAPLTSQQKSDLRAHMMDLEVWKAVISPEQFEFHGLSICRTVDVTAQEIISSIKRDLIEQESIFSQAGFEQLQDKIRSFLGKPGIELGLAALQGDEVMLLNKRHTLEQGCIFANSDHMKLEALKGTIFARTVQHKETLIIDDLQNLSDRTELEDHFLNMGVRNIFIAPLLYKDKLLGGFDLKSSVPGELTPLNTMKLMEILPLFAMALRRGLEELHHRLQAIIKEKCTAIHPSVEWRFQEAALNSMRRTEEQTTGLEPIVFRDVYPLYGLTDIRNSSDYRNRAIQEDLIDHLRLAREILLEAHSLRPLPVLLAMVHSIEKHVHSLGAGLDSGGEVVELDFIQKTLGPVIDHLQEFGPRVQEKVRAYRQALDPDRGTLYRNRKAFESGIARINEAITAILDQEQVAAQSYCPHYFEKIKTDGVDHSIYMGAAILENGKFDLLYLKNLRLWQLIVQCRIVRALERLKPELSVPLESAHLILVQEKPLSIRFRQDERRFDVDGAYDIRHEIIKKRIDKALIRGTGERLTQPGQIAIVYSHPREAGEYQEYLDYLCASGYLEEGVEDCKLDDLQGIQGLKALRIKVSLSDEKAKPASQAAIKEAVRINAV